MENYDFRTEDIKITGWSSKKHGPGVMKITDWPVGIKILHIPTGITVTYDKERFQHKNRELAFLELEEKLKANNKN